MWLSIVGYPPTPLRWEQTDEGLSGRSRPNAPKGPALLLARILPPPFQQARTRAWCLLSLRPPNPRLRSPTGLLKARNGKGQTADICNAPIGGNRLECVAKVRIIYAVIPGRGHQAGSPESSNPRQRFTGFRVRRCAAPRNDNFHGIGRLVWLILLDQLPQT